MTVSELHFYKENRSGDTFFFAYYRGYRITILDRMTGFGYRDIETGFTDYTLGHDDNFWLASGNFDIRVYENLTVEDAIKKIKEYANTCIPKEATCPDNSK